MRDQFHAPSVLPPDKSDGYPWEGGRAPGLIYVSSRFDVSAQTGDRGQYAEDNRTHPYLCNSHAWIRSRDLPSKLAETVELVAISSDVSQLRLQP